MKQKSIMKKGGLLIISLFILFLLSFSASAKQLHADWYFSGDTFKVEDDVFLVTHYDFYATSVILDVNDKTYVIYEGDCKDDGTRQYCIGDIYTELYNATEDDPIKFEQGTAYAGIYILVNERGPDLDVDRAFSTTSPELNEEVTVTVTITNDGSTGTDSFLYKDEYPSGVVILSSSSGTTKTSRGVSYDKNIPYGGERTIIYRFKVTDYMDFTNKATYNYTYAGVRNGFETSSKTVKVEKPYELTTTLSKNTVEATEQVALSVKIENTVSEDITVNELLITIPSFLSLQTKPGELEKKNNRYTWTGVLADGEFKLLNLLLKPIKSGEYEIPVKVEITDSEEKEFSETKTSKFTAEISKLEPILTLSDESISEGSQFRIAFSVKNPNSNVIFNNINAKIKSEIFPDFDIELEELAPGKTRTLFVNDTLRAPFVDETKKYVIEASGSYDTNTYESFNFSQKKTLTVTLVSEAITIIPTIKSEINAGDNLTVTVEIKNNNAEAVQVEVRDSNSENLVLFGGKSSNTIYFDAAGTKQAYTYNIRVPANYEKEELIITTFADILEKGYYANKSTTITIVLPEPLPKPELEPESEPESQPEPELKKEKGFLQKLIEGVSDFFQRLFGRNKEAE